MTKRRRGRPSGRKLVPVTVMLPENLKQWLEQVAQDRMTSAGQVARAILLDAYGNSRGRSKPARHPVSFSTPQEGT